MYNVNIFYLHKSEPEKPIKLGAARMARSFQSGNQNTIPLDRSGASGAHRLFLSPMAGRIAHKTSVRNTACDGAEDEYQDQCSENLDCYPQLDAAIDDEEWHNKGRPRGMLLV